MSLGPSDLLAMAAAFDVLPYDARRRGVRRVRVEKRFAIGQPAAWAICDAGQNNLTRLGAWEAEPINSNKTDDFLARARWPTACAAIAFARHHLARYPSGYAPDPAFESEPESAPAAVPTAPLVQRLHCPRCGAISEDDVSRLCSPATVWDGEPHCLLWYSDTDSFLLAP